MDVLEHLERIRQLKREIWREELEIAAKMPPEQKLLAGPRLFERACMEMTSSVEERHPDAKEEEVVQRLRGALEMVRKLEDLGCVVHLPGDTLDGAYFRNFPAAGLASI